MTMTRGQNRIGYGVRSQGRVERVESCMINEKKNLVEWIGLDSTRDDDDFEGK